MKDRFFRLRVYTVCQTDTAPMREIIARWYHGTEVLDAFQYRYLRSI